MVRDAFPDGAVAEQLGHERNEALVEPEGRGGALAAAERFVWTVKPGGEGWLVGRRIFADQVEELAE
jgi:hypothetical protein